MLILGVGGMMGELCVGAIAGSATANRSRAERQVAMLGPAMTSAKFSGPLAGRKVHVTSNSCRDTPSSYASFDPCLCPINRVWSTFKVSQY